MDLLLDNSDIKKAFIQRGEEFVKLKGVHYMEYHDNLLKRDNSGNILKFRVTALLLLSPSPLFLLSHLGSCANFNFQAEGRAMVDCTSHQKMNPSNLLHPVHEEDLLDHVPSDKLHLC